MLKKLFFCSLVALLTAPAAVAQATDFTWTFTPVTYYSGPTGTLSFTATIDNTGTTDLTSLDGFSAAEGTLPITSGVFGTTGNASLFAEFSGIDILPGKTFTFIFATADFAGVSPGLYTGLVDGGLSLNRTSLVASTNTPYVQIVTPEGGAALMYLLLAAAACFGTMVFSSRGQFGSRKTS